MSPFSGFYKHLAPDGAKGKGGVTTLFAACLRTILTQTEHCPAGVALAPLDFGIDHARARANVCQATAGILSGRAFSKSSSIVFDPQFKNMISRQRGFHLNVSRAL